MAVRIPDKRAGARYAVTMYDPDERPHDIAMGLIVGGKAPLPALPPGCTCCDAPTERRQLLNLSTDRYRVDPMEIPVCEACSDHAFAVTAMGLLVGWCTAMFVAGVVIGIAIDAIALTFVCGLLALGGIAVAMFRAHLLRELVRDGHHTIAVHMAPSKTVLSTTNRRVIVGVVELNRRSVHHVT